MTYSDYQAAVWDGIEMALPYLYDEKITADDLYEATLCGVLYNKTDDYNTVTKKAFDRVINYSY